MNSQFSPNQASELRRFGVGLLFLVGLLAVCFAALIAPTASDAGASTKASEAAAGSADASTSGLRRAYYWYMPSPKAFSTASRFATYFRNQTRPSDYSNDSDLIGASWSRTRVDDCRRRSFSRVNCTWVVFSERFNIIDSAGNVVGEDEFACTGWLDVWYPIASYRKLKIRNTRSRCNWVSEFRNLQ